jgi:hypothetical protein
MSSFQPRNSIPDSWAQIGACPICDERTLSVTHTEGRPDRFSCSNCQVSFEIESDGPSIRLQKLPPKYAAAIQPAFQLWLTPHELRLQIKEATGIPQVPLTVPPVESAVRKLNTVLATSDTIAASPFVDELPTEPLSQDEVTKRALGLAGVGESPREIRETLSRFNATPEQINHAMEYIARQRRKKKSNTPRVIIYVLLVLAICLGSASFVLPMVDIPKYIDIIAPIWNTMQKVFTGNDIWAGTGTNTNLQNTGLSSSEKDYFTTINRIDTADSWWNQYQNVSSIQAPDTAQGIHTQMINEYRSMAIFEAEIERNMSHYNALCTTDEQKKSTPCNRIDSTANNLNNAYDAQKQHLQDWWKITACPTFEDIRIKSKSDWNWSDGTCGPY